MTVFVDTFALIAWLNPKDDAHARVSEYLGSYQGKLVTTEWVLMELADALATTNARSTVIEFLQSVRTDPNYHIVPYEVAPYQDGFKMYSSYHDKGWSLTDCISFGVMTARKLADALTGDKHFAQAGFCVVFEKQSDAGR